MFTKWSSQALNQLILMHRILEELYLLLMFKHVLNECLKTSQH